MKNFYETDKVVATTGPSSEVLSQYFQGYKWCKDCELFHHFLHNCLNGKQKEEARTFPRYKVGYRDYFLNEQAMVDFFNYTHGTNIKRNPAPRDKGED